MLSIVAWSSVENWEERSADLAFQAGASNSALMLQSGINEYINKVVALRALFDAAPGPVDRREFESFARELLKGQNAIRNVSWSPRILNEERAAHEMAAVGEGLAGYRIKTAAANGSYVTSPIKTEYYPIYYRFSNEALDALYGLDIADRGSRQWAFERARDTDQFAASETLALRTGTGDRRGFFVLLPVFRQGAPHASVADRRRNLEGFLQGAFQTRVMVEQILGSIRTPVGVYAITPRAGLAPIWVYAPQAHQPALASEASKRGIRHWSGFLNVADTRWRLDAWSGPGEAVASHISAWIVLVAGLILTAATTVYLWSSIRHAFGLVSANERISQLAMTDTLTGLANRRAFSERLSDACFASRRSGIPFAVLYVDLDHFKDVNDTLGHAIGDALLQEVAKRLKKLIRKTDVVARFGGDEFAVLLADVTNASMSRTLADLIVETLEAPYMIEGNHVRITASVGISSHSAAISEPDSMMVQADLALFHAKEDGRNCARFHTSRLDQVVRERVTIADDLHLALERGELELYYQPQVELASGRIIGLEALVRWNHPERGLIFPATFIPIAEKSGIIVLIGKWVFEQACRQTAVWNEEGIAPEVLAFNMSAIECKRASIISEMSDCLTRWNIKPHQIEVELTETVLMEATQSNGDIVERIRRLGLRIALDDFGTGYSSLSYLTNYPVDRLKIAQELVFGVTVDERNASVVKVAIRLGNELGIEVIAEGVETDAQVCFLAAAGCKRAQGHYFSKPVPAERATKFLRRRFLALGIRHTDGGVPGREDPDRHRQRNGRGQGHHH